MKIKQIAAGLITAVITLFLAFSPSVSLDSARIALKLCETTVIPSLFPFFVCSGILIRLGAADLLGKLMAPVMKPIFRLSGSSSLAIIMGLISGYPVGAKCVCRLVDSGSCHKSEGEKLLAFCNNSGPLFILGAVGNGMLCNPRGGVLLYISHFAACITVALLMRNIPCRLTACRDSKNSDISFGEALTDSIKNAADSVFTISGFVIVFNILLSYMDYFGITRIFSSFGVSKAAFFGFFEPVNGCLTASETVKGFGIFPVISAIIGWSGISVHFQVLGIIKKSGLSPKYYFTGKLLMTVISPIYTVLLFKLFPASATVAGGFSYNLPRVYMTSAAFFLLSFVCVFIFTLLCRLFTKSS